MKSIILKIVSTLIAACLPLILFTQDLSHLVPVCDYTLINTNEDALGLQDTIMLLNTPFSGDQGVYCNGLYPGEHADGCLIQTPLFSALYDSIWAVQLEFNITQLDGQVHPILVCGGSYRYLGFMIGFGNTFELLFNNGITTVLDNVTPEENHWYTLTLIHHRDPSLSEFYLDGALIASDPTELIRVPNDGNILNTHPGIGITFLGYWRNLQVFGSEVISGIKATMATHQQKMIFPNPASQILQLDFGKIPVDQWEITDSNGMPVRYGNPSASLNQINISDLLPGIYVVILKDREGTILNSQIFIKE